ncbi:MAG: geranylgeranyl pyrophosphate synthase [Pseudohongiellaceae bacterium]|jgi:geranylgeranyl pyrophosphate synthase
MTDQFQQFLHTCQQRVEQALSQQLSVDLLNQGGLSEQLDQAIKYSLFNGGKRVRPVLVYAAALAVNSNTDDNLLNGCASAIEMIHSYSLVHDDLPAMDDDDLRRGKPTCHIAFNEATAILAGDALQAQAFALLTELDCSAETKLTLINTLAHAAGPRGMVGGQAIDLAAEGQNINLEQLEGLHRLKTGALISAAVRMGATAAQASERQCQNLEQYAQAIGLAFQVQDDILDIESDTETLGKQQGADVAHNKSTYPSLLGLDQAKNKAQELHQLALDALAEFDDNANPLRELSAYIIDRRH